MKKKDLVIISHLRKNARETLTRMSRKTSIPVSTLYDKLKLHTGNLIKKNTALIDFSKIGFHARANVALKVDREQRQELKEFLLKNNNINSVYKINNGFDFLAECIFKHIKELEDFLESVDAKFKVRNRQVYYIIEDLKREDFLTDPELIDVLV